MKCPDPVAGIDHCGGVTFTLSSPGDLGRDIEQISSWTTGVRQTTSPRSGRVFGILGWIQKAHTLMFASLQSQSSVPGAADPRPYEACKLGIGSSIMEAHALKYPDL